MSESKHTERMRQLEQANADLLAACEAAEVFARLVIESGLGVRDERVIGAIDLLAAARAAIAKAKGGAA